MLLPLLEQTHVVLLVLLAEMGGSMVALAVRSTGGCTTTSTMAPLVARHNLVHLFPIVPDIAAAAAAAPCRRFRRRLPPPSRHVRVRTPLDLTPFLTPIGCLGGRRRRGGDGLARLHYGHLLFGLIQRQWDLLLCRWWGRHVLALPILVLWGGGGR